jgi:hypothetical protein
MIQRDLSYARWAARRGGVKPQLARLDAALAPFRRMRLRTAEEALILRRLGTPEGLVGPVGSDDDVARERQDLVDFARRLRAHA